jgi:C-terminal processing protease CtpA/Prc
MRYFAMIGARSITRRRLPITLATESLGFQPFHRHIVLLINQHTASANEILLAFAKENRLAIIVGEASPGHLLSGEKINLPYGYRLSLPVGELRTAQGENVEGNPIVPDVSVPFDPDLAREGHDNQLQAALEVVSKL